MVLYFVEVGSKNISMIKNMLIVFAWNMYILIASFELMLESLLIYGRYENRKIFKTTCIAITAATCACATNKVG